MALDPEETVAVDKLVAGGKGLGRLADGRVVFVPAVVPGDRVVILDGAERGDFVEALEVRVVESGPGRVAADCPAVALGCGGCDWRHLERSRHLQAKTDIVRESFVRTARLDPPIIAAQSVDPASRRTTVRLAADADGRLGVRRAASHEPVVLGACSASHARLESLLATVRLTGPGEAVLRVGARTGEAGIWVTEGALSEESAEFVRAEALAVGKRARVAEIVHGHRLGVSMGSFFQASPEGAELVVATVRSHLERAGARGGTLADLYGGVGLFAVALADVVDEIVLVESNPLACRDAMENLATTAATVEQADMGLWEPAPADIVVADPSREGLGKRAAAAVAGTEAGVVVLVSCDAPAAARDGVLLGRHGYRLTEVSVLDLFPDTHHVEVVSTFVAAAAAH